MTSPFPQWRDRIADARDERARRALLGEIGVWRAQRLTDLPAQRDAAWALSELYHRLGETDPAAHEAQQLLALCKTPPAAAKEVLRYAEQHARRVAKPAKPAKGRGRNRPDDTGYGDAYVLATQGRWDDAREALGGRKGGRAQLFRTWCTLGAALDGDAEALRPALEGLRDALAADLKPAEAPAADVPADAPAAAGSALAALLGKPVPSKRNSLLAALDGFVAEHPDRMDDLAAAALRHHVAQHGDKSVAPWLARYVGAAMAAGKAPETTAAIAEHADAYATTLYGEDGFRRAVAAWKAAVGRGHTPTGLRRGVGTRGKPEHIPWTVDTEHDGKKGTVVVVSQQGAPWERAEARRTADKIARLGGRVVLHAPGGQREALREAASEAGVAVVDAKAIDAAFTVLEALPAGKAKGRGKAAPAEVAPEAAPATEASAPPATPDKPKAEPKPDPTPALAEAFEQGADASVYAPLFEQLDRAWRAFAALRPVRERLSAVDFDARLVPFLEALHASVPPEVRLAEGTGMVLETAAAVPDGAVARFLAEGGEAAARFGGQALLGFAGVVRAAVEQGASVGRLLLGVTRREGRENAALGPLAAQVDGLWRLLVSVGDHKGELWWLADATPEARAAATLLLASPASRVVAHPADETAVEVPEGAGALVPWTGAEADAVGAAVAGWGASA